MSVQVENLEKNERIEEVGADGVIAKAFKEGIVKDQINAEKQKSHLKEYARRSGRSYVK